MHGLILIINVVQMQISDPVGLENSTIRINYLCNTSYVTQSNVTVTIVVSTKNRTFYHFEVACSTGSFLFNGDLSQCGQIIDLSGYWTFTDDINCSLFNYSKTIDCPTKPPSYTGILICT